MTTADLSVTTSGTPRPPATRPPARFDPATEARLNQLDHEATAHVEANRPERTRTGYAADWNAWLRFCADAELVFLIADGGRGHVAHAVGHPCWTAAADSGLACRPPGAAVQEPIGS
ncbi:hypothetical protein [Streptomyces sp. NPDC087437]|uniref:hypothetical protein n=1 Tax=Streptomyces sp. NPDC087437 TaxID=3365789 RepID=UPI0037F66A5C